MMKENRKIVIHKLGEDFRQCTKIVAEPIEKPAEGQVLIRHHFAGVNGVYDQMMCANRVEHTPVSPPADTGVEALGVVDAVGRGVNRFSVGDPVMTVEAGGGYRLYSTVSEAAAISVSEVSRAVLALVPSGVSAMLALERVGKLAHGETVCITAAAGGLGNIATQLAIRAGNHVIAVCGSDDKAAWLRSIGADRVVQYRREPLSDVLLNEYADSIDLAMDSVGGEIFDALVNHLAPHGRLVVCGATTDRLPPAKVLHERVYTKLYWKAASVRGFMNYRFSDHAADARRRLFAMQARGDLAPLVDKRNFVGLDDVASAVGHLLRGDNVGKVTVDLR